MYNHASAGYICPICVAIEGVEDEHTMAKQADIVYRDEHVLVYVNSKFIGKNPGHVIVVPTRHFENIFDLHPTYARRIMDVSQMMARALMTVRKCDGVYVVQNNGPASGQHALHYHQHIIPRWNNDNLRLLDAQGDVRVADPAERLLYAEALRAYLRAPKTTVDFVPSSYLALVYVPNQQPGSSPCYAVSPEMGVRDESAPQLFNIHMDPYLDRRVPFEDVHPFPKVLEELKRRIALYKSH